jgi:aminomethyltransferase
MKTTILNKTHRDQGGKMVEFAGFDMPVQYSQGMLKEHEWVRSGNVGVFDVSHMGQFFIKCQENSAQSFNELVKFLSYITPTDFSLSNDYQAKYTVLTNDNGGIIDDLIITKINNYQFFIVLNAACKEKDANWIKSKLPKSLIFEEIPNRSLVAVQGEKSVAILSQIIKNIDLENLAYMNLAFAKIVSNDAEIIISRTGYTGEDGFEVSIDNKFANDFWLNLCKYSEVLPIGLGARDSLRLEMGYPLYGHDLNDETSPIEASLGWVVSKSNQNFIGNQRIIAEKSSGTKIKRMGIKLVDKGIAREGTEIFLKNGVKIGTLTSGGFSPSLKTSIGQGYFDSSLVKNGDEVFAMIRGREALAIVQSFTFINPKTKIAKKS